MILQAIALVAAAPSSAFTRVTLSGSNQLFNVDLDAGAAMQTFSSRFYLGTRPYLEPAPNSTGFFLEPSLTACRNACMQRAPCKYGTYITGGVAKGQCWLSSHTAEKLSECGVPCVSFWKTTVGELRNMEYAKRTIKYDALRFEDDDPTRGRMGGKNGEEGGNDPFIANPERGFAHTLVSFASNFRPLDETQLRKLRVEDKITLVHRVFVLDTFVAKPISASFLHQVRLDFETSRRTGIKLIVRFAYSMRDSTKPPFNDADMPTVLGHIKQLQPILKSHGSVMAALHAGFIGEYGGWQYSSAFGDMSYPLSEQNWKDRARVLAALLESLDTDTYVLLPRPAWKMRLLGNTPMNKPRVLPFHGGNSEAKQEASLFFFGKKGQALAARAGEYNDCLGDVDHRSMHADSRAKDGASFFLGRKGSQSTAAAFLRDDSRFTPLGAEPCAAMLPDGAEAPSAAPMSCAKALTELKAYHYDMLASVHSDAGRAQLATWKAGGCLDQIKEDLGYRFTLRNGTFSSRAPVGGTIDVEFWVRNEGFSAPFARRVPKLVMRHKITSQICVAPLDADPRLWVPGRDHKVSQRIFLHDVHASAADMADGEYELLLFMPDQNDDLEASPSYSVRFANDQVFETWSGYNKLRHSVTVRATTSRELLTEQLMKAAKNKHTAVVCGGHHDTQFGPPLPAREWDAIPFVANPSFERVNDYRQGIGALHDAFHWELIGNGYRVVIGQPGEHTHTGSHAIVVRSGVERSTLMPIMALSGKHGARYRVNARGAMPQYISIGAWSRPEKVTDAGNKNGFANPPESYSIYADVHFSDGTSDIGIHAPFKLRASNWNRAFVRQKLKWQKPITAVDVYVLFGAQSGAAYFDDVYIGFADDRDGQDTTIGCVRGAYPVGNERCVQCPPGTSCSRMGKLEKCKQGTYSIEGQDTCSKCPSCDGHENIHPVCAVNTGMCICLDGWLGYSCQYPMVQPGALDQLQALQYNRCATLNCTYREHNRFDARWGTHSIHITHPERAEEKHGNEHICKYAAKEDKCECFCRKAVLPTQINPWLLAEKAPSEMVEPGEAIKPLRPSLSKYVGAKTKL